MKATIMGKGGLRTVDLNRRTAIRERCLNCSCWMPGEVMKCSFTDCALHPFRSGEGKQDPEARGKAIRAYCLWCMAGQHSEVVKCPSVRCPLFRFKMTKRDRPTACPSLCEKPHGEAISERERGQGISL